MTMVELSAPVNSTASRELSIHDLLTLPLAIESGQTGHKGSHPWWSAVATTLHSDIFGLLGTHRADE